MLLRTAFHLLLCSKQQVNETIHVHYFKGLFPNHLSHICLSLSLFPQYKYAVQHNNFARSWRRTEEAGHLRAFPLYKGKLKIINKKTNKWKNTHTHNSKNSER